MKLSIFLLTVTVSCILQPAEAQVNDIVGADSVVYTIVEQQAQYPGGMDAMVQLLLKNIQYPKEARRMKIQGKVFVSFIVEKDGSITDIKVIKGIGGGCDEEAIRLVSLFPKWVSGMQNGKPVRTRFVQPLNFKLGK